MTEPLLYILMLSLGSAVLAVALTKTVMASFTSGAIEGMIDEEWRTGHGVTHLESASMAVLAAITTFVLSVSFGTGPESLLFAALAAFGVSMCYTDLLDYLIFNVVVYPFYVATALGLLLYWNVNDLGVDFLIGALVGGAVSYAIYIVQWIVSGYRLGFGDVRLSAPLGAIAGAFGAGLPIAAIVAANVLALVVIILNAIWNAVSRAEVHSHIAFGPFMVYGLALTLLFREPVMEYWTTNTQAVLWVLNGMPM
jgi:leader peptidase (prepilin peptidase)/N-methyltransferase